MAFSSGSGRGPQADINVTPLVDIVLVLLIIFMVITPMLNEGANVTLPKAQHTEVAKDDEEQPTTISVTKDGAIWLGKEQLTVEQLETEILTVVLGDPRAAIVIKGDGQTRYADVRAVMKVLENVGAKGVRLQADQAKADPAEQPEQEG